MKPARPYWCTAQLKKPAIRRVLAKDQGSCDECRRIASIDAFSSWTTIPSIHVDFRRILQLGVESETLEPARSALFGESIPVPSHEPFEVDCVDQGQAALAKEGGQNCVMALDVLVPGMDPSEQLELQGKRVTPRSGLPAAR